MINKRIIVITIISLFIGILGLESKGKCADVKIWDLNEKYDYKHYGFTDQWNDKANWTQVPYGTTSYVFNGDCAIEGENFWFSFHSSPYDAVFLYAKVNEEGKPSRHNEMYRSWDTPNGLRNYGGGSQLVKILKNQAEEVMVYSEAITYERGGYLTTVTTSYRALAGKQWIELRPVSQCSEQGMHGESRIHISPEMGGSGNDYTVDSLKHGLGGLGERVYHPDNSVMLLDFIMDADIIWTMNWKNPRHLRARSDTAYQGYQAGWNHIGDNFMDIDRIITSPFVYYDNEPIVVGILYKKYWHFQNINQSITAGVPFTGTWTRAYDRLLPYETVHPGVGSPWIPGYPGKYRITGCVNGEYYTEEIDIVTPDVNFSFTSPVSGTLEYLIIYMYDSTVNTPGDLYTPMDIYRETIPEVVNNGTITGEVTDESNNPIGGVKITNGVEEVETLGDGTYILSGIPEGVYVLIASASGYEKAFKAADVIGNGNIIIDFKLLEDNTPPEIMNVAVSAIFTSSSTITWGTDELSDTQVEYGTTIAYGKITILDNTPTFTHSQTLTELQTNTLYHFRVKSKDARGNQAVSDDYTFTTLPPIDPDYPSWWSYYVGNGEGIWGRSYAEAHSETFSAFMKVIAYGGDSINIGLIAGKSNGYSGTEAYSMLPNTTYNYSFWIKGDLMRVLVSALTWTTEEATSGDRVYISLDNMAADDTWKKYEGTFSTGSDTKKFVLIFKAYGNSTEENLGIVYVDDVNVSVTEGENLIKNPGAEDPPSSAPPPPDPEDNSSPIISNVTANLITASQVTVSWSTNEKSDSQVEYGESINYNMQTVLITSLVNNHRQIIDGLKPITTYHYCVESKDQAGNKAISNDYTFTTLPTCKIVVGPNPYRADKEGEERITFKNLPVQATIRIYTLSGKLVKTIKHKNTLAGGVEEWDVSDIGSGVYIYYIDGSSGRKKGKVSIIK